MAKVVINLYFFLQFISLLIITQASRLAIHPNRSHTTKSSFVAAQCKGTRYPQLCMKSLSNYVHPTMDSPQQLAHIALMVSLARAQYTKSYLIKVAKQIKARDYEAMRDCLYEINDGIDQLTRSVKELRGIKQDDERHFLWHQSNVQTWTSTALTDALACLDGFSRHGIRGKMRATLKAKLLNVAQLTSNALALFNRYVTRHRVTKP